MYVGPGSGQGQLPWMMYRLRDIRSGSCRAVPAAFYLGTRASGLKPFARQSLPTPQFGRRFASGRGRAVRRAKPTWRVLLVAASLVRSEVLTSIFQYINALSYACLCLTKITH